MIYKIKKALVICGLLLHIFACSAYQPFEADVPSKPYSSGNQILLDPFNLKCELMAIRINSSMELVSPRDNVRPKLRFSNGNYSGTGVCNSFNGEYVRKENAINFKSASSSMVGCTTRYSGIEFMSGNEVESLILRTLGQVNNYLVDKDKLILKQDSGILLIYRII